MVGIGGCSPQVVAQLKKLPVVVEMNGSYPSFCSYFPGSLFLLYFKDSLIVKFRFGIP